MFISFYNTFIVSNYFYINSFLFTYLHLLNFSQAKIRNSEIFRFWIFDAPNKLEDWIRRLKKVAIEEFNTGTIRKMISPFVWLEWEHLQGSYCAQEDPSFDNHRSFCQLQWIFKNFMTMKISNNSELFSIKLSKRKMKIHSYTFIIKVCPDIWFWNEMLHWDQLLKI